jgi:uncharacterized protein
MNASALLFTFGCVCVGIALAGYLLICLLVAHRFTTVKRRSEPGAPVDPELAAQQVHFPARDQRARIAAWYLPVPAARGAVIFVHGKDSARGDELKAPTVALARRFNAAGLTVLMIDLRGHGASSGGRLTFGARECDDVLGAVDYLLERGFAHGTIGALGASMGGVAALQAAARDEAIGAVAADSPYADFGAMIDRRFTKISRLPRWFLPGALALAWLLTGVHLRRVRPIDDAGRLRGRPLLIVHGRHDPFVPVADARALAAASDATLWLTDSAHHLGSYRDAPETYGLRMAEFFGDSLQPQSAHRAEPAVAAVDRAAPAGFEADLALA